MSVSRKRQYQLLTEHGKFAPTGFVEVKELDFTHAAAAFISASEEAAKSYFPEECGLQKCVDWREACDVLQREEVNFAFLPMQDPTSGYVSANYNLVGRVMAFTFWKNMRQATAEGPLSADFQRPCNFERRGQDQHLL